MTDAERLRQIARQMRAQNESMARILRTTTTVVGNDDSPEVIERAADCLDQANTEREVLLGRSRPRFTGVVDEVRWLEQVDRFRHQHETINVSKLSDEQLHAIASILRWEGCR